MQKQATLPAIALIAALGAAPAFAQAQPDAQTGSDQGVLVPNATPAGPDFDPNVQQGETAAPQAMDPPDEGTNGAPTATTGTQDLDAGTDAGSEDEDAACKPAD